MVVMVGTNSCSTVLVDASVGLTGTGIRLVLVSVITWDNLVSKNVSARKKVYLGTYDW